MNGHFVSNLQYHYTYRPTIFRAMHISIFTIVIFTISIKVFVLQIVVCYSHIVE